MVAIHPRLTRHPIRHQHPTPAAAVTTSPVATTTKRSTLRPYSRSKHIRFYVVREERRFFPDLFLCHSSHNRAEYPRCLAVFVSTSRSPSFSAIWKNMVIKQLGSIVPVTSMVPGTRTTQRNGSLSFRYQSNNQSLSASVTFYFSQSQYSEQPFTIRCLKLKR